MKRIKIKWVAFTATIALLLGSGCLSITYRQETDRINQTETVKVTARGLFKDTTLAGAAGASTLSVTDTNGSTYTSTRNVGATNLATIVSTNASGIVEAAGGAGGRLLNEAIGGLR